MIASQTHERRFFVHPAHTTVGMAGCRSYFAAVQEKRPVAAALLADRWDAEAQAARRVFQQTADENANVRFRCVDLDLLPIEELCADEPNCVVLFGAGLQIARRWADLDLAAASGVEPAAGRRAPITVETAADAGHHPVLAGVEPFASRERPFAEFEIPDWATKILYARSPDRLNPLAWICGDRCGGMLQTVLGSPDDFRQPAFCRLMLNSIRWIGQ